MKQLDNGQKRGEAASWRGEMASDSMPSPASPTPRMLPAWALKPDFKWSGLLVAAAVMVVWASTLRHALWLEVGTTGRLHLAVTFVALVQSYTGLFITAHDAMHGLVAPKHAMVNRRMGQLCAGAFAAFSYDLLLVSHRQHHAHPATSKARHK